jgi:hypothetical protein
MNYDYAIHSDFLIHWTGKDIDNLYDKQWYELDKSKTKKNCNVTGLYIKRLLDILKYGLWMTEEQEEVLRFGDTPVPIPLTPKTCFTELKVSESRKHAKQYGRLGIGVKRPFVFTRFGRPVIYYGFHREINNDKFLKKSAMELQDKSLLNFFKPMNSSKVLNYDFYAESEWRILYFEELLTQKLIVDPRNPVNTNEHAYFNSLPSAEQAKLKYLVPLDGWFSMIIYPSLDVKNSAQQDTTNGIVQEIERIKTNIHDHGNRVEGCNWPIEVDLDACRNF